MILIGFIAYRATKNFSDYILGGRTRQLRHRAVGGRLGHERLAADGLPGAIFVAGLSESWIAIGLIIGAWLNWLFVAGRLRVHTEHNHNALTLPDYFSHRFEDESRMLRIFRAGDPGVLHHLLRLAWWPARGSSPPSACPTNTHCGRRCGDHPYVFIGGFLAVSWTDTVQATLMIFALLITPLFVILALGDMGTVMATIEAQNPANFDMFRGLSFVAIISLLAWGLGYFGQPHILVRFMAADSIKTIPNARRIGMTWMILTLAGAVAVGFLGIAYFADHPDQAGAVSQNGERVFMELVKILFNPCGRHHSLACWRR